MLSYRLGTVLYYNCIANILWKYAYMYVKIYCTPNRQNSIALFALKNVQQIFVHKLLLY